MTGQDTKEAYNRTLEKQKLTKMKPALKAGFVWHVPLPLTLQRVRLCCNLYVLKKNIILPSILHSAHFKQYCFR
jgi:hypothetical protein